MRQLHFQRISDLTITPENFVDATLSDYYNQVLGVSTRRLRRPNKKRTPSRIQQLIQHMLRCMCATPFKCTHTSCTKGVDFIIGKVVLTESYQRKHTNGQIGQDHFQHKLYCKRVIQGTLIQTQIVTRRS